MVALCGAEAGGSEVSETVMRLPEELDDDSDAEVDCGCE